ncbi:hypothetical protein MAHJHV33_50000 [Mycobacterium avium subsp. hominissuis]
MGGQASSTHMGELRNVETHQMLYYPSVFHALIAVFCQLTGAALLTWRLLRPSWGEWRTAGAAATPNST